MKKFSSMTQAQVQELIQAAQAHLDSEKNSQEMASVWDSLYPIPDPVKSLTPVKKMTKKVLSAPEYNGKVYPSWVQLAKENGLENNPECMVTWNGVTRLYGPYIRKYLGL